MTIHNPWGLSLIPKDISQGWRFCYVEELLAGRPEGVKFKMKGELAWSSSCNAGQPCTPGNLEACTYVTRMPVPQKLSAPPWAKPAPSAPAEPDELDVLTQFLGDD